MKILMIAGLLWAGAAQAASDEEVLLQHIKVLASDKFEGRAPGSKGEQLSIAYIQQQFKQLGLAPGNPDGTYLQAVPMAGITSKPSFSYTVGGKPVTLRFPEDYIARSVQQRDAIAVSQSEMVFVGYGVVAPEYGWDDFKGQDLRGKTLVMLINDPPLPDPQMFKGEEMTYYGRWTYKFEMAAKLGAAAAIIVHETKPAGYPYGVVTHTWADKNLALDSSAARFPTVAGWMQADRARELFAAAGQDFDALKQAALSKDFKPVNLHAEASFNIANRIEKVQSHNVLAKITGSDPLLKNETVIYSAHWDHLGRKGRKIFHGALDNAGGIGALLQIARAYKALPAAPKRTVLFIATTGEEQGLLGSQYYASNPLYPLATTVADLNIDVINAYGRTSDLRIIGAGRSDLDALVMRYAASQGRTALPDANPELGSFYRSDQFEFAKAGVPVVFLKAGTQVIGKPAQYGADKKRDYVAHLYHTVDDVVDKQWDLSGAVEDAQLLFQIGFDLAQGSAYPRWNPDSEFQRKEAAK